MNYQEAGVDIQKGDLFVNNISSIVKKSFNSNVKNDLSSFASLYDVGPFLLSACTDGVGTKLMLAMELNDHSTIGQDLVAMNVNDLICNGSKPLFFLDYIACHKLNLENMSTLVNGINQACIESNCALIGGETAEMNDLYQENHYDLAGFALGMVDKDKLIDGKDISLGDLLISLDADGFHANGFSLIRKLLKSDELELKQDLLRPTPLYVNLIMKLIELFPGEIHGLTNITGGGIENIKRMNKSFDYLINNPVLEKDLPLFMQTITKRSHLSLKEKYQVFNMGMGMVMAVNPNSPILEYLNDQKISHKVIGKVLKGNGKILF